MSLEANQIDHEKVKADQPIPSSHKEKNHLKLLLLDGEDESASDEQIEPAELRNMAASKPSLIDNSEPSLKILPNESLTLNKPELVGSRVL